MRNLHAFTIKYLGPTNHKGSRVKIKSERFNQSVIIPYNYSFDSELEIAENYLRLKGFEIIGAAKDCIISSTFEELKGIK